ncbi:MAG: hypothetical protein KDA69_09225 [Planctomycetaceae bacterium]|nr:hypothetical protein [Planctomycetaceae bacterium]MCA9044490.1 hypothetical protein [Planctomycetaceae bacterium]
MKFTYSFLFLSLALLCSLGCGPNPSEVVDESTEETSTELSAEDQALVDQQKICPVGGSELGSMGTPIKVMVGERPVFLCCEGCEKALLADPDKYLAILDNPEAEEAPEGQNEEASPTEAEPTEGEANAS